MLSRWPTNYQTDCHLLFSPKKKSTHSVATSDVHSTIIVSKLIRIHSHFFVSESKEIEKHCHTKTSTSDKELEFLYDLIVQKEKPSFCVLILMPGKKTILHLRHISSLHERHEAVNLHELDNLSSKRSEQTPRARWNLSWSTRKWSAFIFLPE